MYDSLTEGQETRILVFICLRLVRGVLTDFSFFFIVLGVGLIAGHFLDFGDRDVVEVLHCFAVDIRKVMLARSFFVLGDSFDLLLSGLKGELLSLSQLGR
jgi:hypothetical protein